jgi:hypothetical protein
VLLWVLWRSRNYHHYMDIQPAANETNQEHTSQTQSQVIKSTETFLYGFLSSAASHFIKDTCLKNVDNKPVPAVYVYYRSNLLQSSSYTKLTDQLFCLQHHSAFIWRWITGFTKVYSHLLTFMMNTDFSMTTMVSVSTSEVQILPHCPLEL